MGTDTAVEVLAEIAVITKCLKATRKSVSHCPFGEVHYLFCLPVLAAVVIDVVEAKKQFFSFPAACACAPVVV